MGRLLPVHRHGLGEAFQLPALLGVLVGEETVDELVERQAGAWDDATDKGAGEEDGRRAGGAWSRPFVSAQVAPQWPSCLTHATQPHAIGAESQMPSTPK
jgi:hypothetical protein